MKSRFTWVGLGVLVLVFGCTSTPLPPFGTYKPGDHVKLVTQFLGEPTRIEQLGGFQVWQYCDTGEVRDEYLALLIEGERVVETTGYYNELIGDCASYFKDAESLYWQTIDERNFVENAPPPATETATPNELDNKLTSGSGVVVSHEGHVVTNAHVVEGCYDIRAGGTRRAGIVDVNRAIDLALLETPIVTSNVATLRSGDTVRAGEDIVVLGYPLQGLLASEVSVSTGIVSALAGPGNDRRLVQITAPVQPGNSGGPLLDRAGNLVGVVVAKLDAIQTVEATGVLPENVNFAISATVVRAFLDIHAVPHVSSQSDVKLSTPDIAARGSGFTIPIECWG